jgi:hypothetical protein
MVQQSMSAEKTPILSVAIPCFEMFMTRWEQLGLEHPHLSKWTSVGIEWALKYYERIDATRAYVVAMGRFELCFPAVHVFTDRCQPLTQVHRWGRSESMGRQIREKG